MTSVAIIAPAMQPITSPNRNILAIPLVSEDAGNDVARFSENAGNYGDAKNAHSDPDSYPITNVHHAHSSSPISHPKTKMAAITTTAPQKMNSHMLPVLSDIGHFAKRRRFLLTYYFVESLQQEHSFTSRDGPVRMPTNPLKWAFL
jgi:hypothetical protein